MGIVSNLGQSHLNCDKKPGPSNQIWGTFAASHPREITSAGLSPLLTYCHWSGALDCRIMDTRFATYTLNRLHSLWIYAKTIRLSVQYVDDRHWTSSADSIKWPNCTAMTAAANSSRGMAAVLMGARRPLLAISTTCTRPSGLTTRR